MGARLILVIEDDNDIRKIVCEVLTDEGYAIKQAINGQEALDSMQNISPCLIILDMNMPVLDGWGFARRLAELQIYIPILVMTAAQNARKACNDIGAAACIPKPFELDMLLETVERYCPDAVVP